MQDAVIVSAMRTAVGKAPKGTLSVMRPDELGAVAIKRALDRVPPPSIRRLIEDVILGELRHAGSRARHERGALRAAAAGGPSPRERARRPGEPLLLVRHPKQVRGWRPPSGSWPATRRLPPVAGGTESMTVVPMMGHKVVGPAQRR